MFHPIFCRDVKNQYLKILLNQDVQHDKIYSRNHQKGADKRQYQNAQTQTEETIDGTPDVGKTEQVF